MATEPNQYCNHCTADIEPGEEVWYNNAPYCKGCDPRGGARKPAPFETARRGVRREEADGLRVELFVTFSDGKEYRYTGYILDDAGRRRAERLIRACEARAFGKALALRPCNQHEAPGKF